MKITFKTISVLFAIFATVFMLFFAWIMAFMSEREMKDNLLLQTEIGARSINIEHFKNLTGTPKDLGTTDYLRLKEQFASILTVNKKLRFVYLMGLKENGQLFFYADDRPVGDVEESPAGMVYEDAPDGFFRVMQTGIASIEGPFTDKWGSFVSGCVPLVDPKTGKTMAIFAIDFDARLWYWEIATHAALPVGLLVVLLLGAIVVLVSRNRGKRLRESEENFRTFFGSIADLLFVLDGSGNMIDVNETVLRRLGYSKEELIGQSVLMVHPENRRSEAGATVAAMLEGTKDFCPVPLLSKSGVEFQVETRVYPGVWNGNPALFGVVKDLTSIKQSEEKFHKVFQSGSNLMAISTSSTGRFIDVNDLFLRVLGFTREEVIGTSSNEVIIFDDAEKGACIKSIMEDQGFAKDIEVKIRTKTGNMLLGLFSAAPLTLGEEQCWLTTITDLTKRKKAEEALIESNQKFEAIILASPDGIGMASLDGKLQLMSDKLISIFGYSLEEKSALMGRVFFDFIDPGYHEKLRENMQKLLAGKNSNKINEYLAIKKDNSRIYVDLNASVLFDSNGLPSNVLFVERDITERKQTEEALRESQALYHSFVEHMPAGVFRKDSEGRFNFVNSLFCKLKGLSANEIIGKTIKELSDYEETLEAGSNREIMHRQKTVLVSDEATHHDEIMHSGKPIEIEEFYTYADGTFKYLDVVKSPVFSATGKVIGSQGIQFDITELKKMEEVLLKAKQEAESANKSKSLFLENMSHEIRTPLNAIIGFSQLMNRDKLLTDSQREYNVSIIRAGEHLLLLINDILELSKIEAGRVVLNPTNIDLHALFEDIQIIFKENLRSKNLQFIFETAEDLPSCVRVDEHRLRQIFINLVGNAVKFTEQGGIAVRVRVDKSNKDTMMLVVEIQDSGPGISEEELVKLFKNFEQTSTGIKKGSGTGLGLALSRELAILMGGDITVSSQVGKGSVFTFRVEVKEGKFEVDEKTISKHVVCIDKGRKTYRILCVDDKEENLKVVVNLLKLVGFETNEAVDGSDAIAKFEEWSPDLILMDMRMPVMDGYEATRRIKSMEKGQQTPIVALTASSFEEERMEMAILGMQGYIRKPFNENELFDTIAEILDIKYIYEDKKSSGQEKYLNDDGAILEDISKLAKSIVQKMLDALAIADLDLLIELIKSIETENPELSQQLKMLANNYDYDYLQQILNPDKVQ